MLPRDSIARSSFPIAFTECHIYRLQLAGLALPYHRTPILHPAVDLPVRAHALYPMDKDRQQLYSSLCRMLKQMTLFFRSALLVPHLFSLTAAVMSAVDMPFVDVTLDVFVRRLRTFVTERLQQYPLGEVSTDELMATVERFQKIALLGQRIAALVRQHVEPWDLTGLVSGIARDIWQAANSASRSTDAHTTAVSPVARADQVLLSLLSHTSCPLLTESSSMQDYVLHLLDPARTGFTTLVEFDATASMLDQFSSEGFSSLHYLLLCRSVVFLQCEEVATSRVRHVEAGYIVSIGPCVVSFYRRGKACGAYAFGSSACRPIRN